MLSTEDGPAQGLVELTVVIKPDMAPELVPEVTTGSPKGHFNEGIECRV